MLREALRRLAWTAVLGLPLLTPGAAHGTLLGPAPLHPLDERTLGIGESHDYFFPMKAGEYLRIDVEQNDDIDAGIRLYDATGRLLFHANSYTGTHGAETLSWIAERSEVLRVEVYIWQPDRIGRYRALADGPREPTEYDQLRSVAAKLFYEGTRLQEAQQFWMATTSLAGSASRWQRLNEIRWKAVASWQLADGLDAQRRYSQSVTIFRSIWPTLLGLEEGALIPKAAICLVRDLEDHDRGDEMVEIFRLAIPYISTFPPGLASEYYLAFANVAERTGRLEWAAVFLRHLVSSERLEVNPAGLTGALGSLSRVLRRLGQVHEAALQAKKMSVLAATPETKTRAGLAQGLVALASEDFSTAISLLDSSPSSTVSRRLNSDLHYAKGRVLFEERDYPGALRNFQIALNLKERGARSLEFAFLSLVHLRLGETGKAAELLHLAKSENAHNNADEVAFLHRVGAELALELGNRKQFLDELDGCFQMLERQRDRIGSETLQASYWATRTDYIDFALTGLRRFGGAGQDPSLTARAFLLIEKTRSPLLSKSLATPSPLRTLQPRAASLENALNLVDDQLANLRSRRPPGWRIQTARLEQRRREIPLSTALAEAQGSREPTAKALAPLSLSELQAALAPDESLITFFLGRERSYAWVLSPEAISQYSLPPKSVIQATCRRVLHELDASRHAANSPGAEEELQALSDLILGPLRGRLVRRRLFLGLDGVLHRIPFAALPDPDVTGGLLVDRFEVVSVPSLTSIVTARKQKRTCQGTAVVAASDPSIQSQLDFRAALQLDPRATLVTATRDRFLNGSLRTYCYVHVAAHGSADEVWPDTASLQLRGDFRSATSRVYAFELERTSLNAKLVTLAACESGVGDLRGEGLFGLPRALLIAGSQSVLASLWRVDGSSTGELMSRFYAELGKGASAATALRSAQLAFRSARRQADPALWAAFQLVGDPQVAPLPAN